MRFRVLGPLEVVHADRPIDVGPPKQRVVLAMLLMAGGRVVSVDRLVDAVWGNGVPASANAGLQVYISNLRRTLRGSGAAGVASPIVRRPPGYALDLEPDDLDLTVFTARCAHTRAAVDAKRWDEALTEADSALALVRGELLEDLRDADWLRDEAARIAALRTECHADRAVALLALGQVSEALTEVGRLRERDPLSDRTCRLQMVALYRAGRTPEALETFARHARMLDTELGLRPGREVEEVQTAILRQAPELAAWPRPPEWSGATALAVPVPGPNPAPQPPPAVSVPQTVSLAGRGRELARARDLVARVHSGATRWLVLSGPPGIGKTRLAEEIANLVTASGGDAIWVACPDERATPPWWPMRHLVRALGADADAVVAVPAHADPDTARFLVYERIQALLEKTPRMLAVVVDDVQWSDTTSASALSYIAGALRDRPMLMVLTVRDGEHAPEVARLLATVARGDDNRHVEVPALSSDDVAALAGQIADDAVTPAEAAELAARTGGNPFFVSEYARLPREERSRNEIPRAVRSVLDRRLAALSPDVQQVLRTAAVVGEVIDGGAVAVLARTTSLDLDTLADHLDAAADERILVGAHSGDGYEFAHGLLRQQLLSGLPPMRRQRLHLTVAEVLAGHADADAVSRRAQHLVAAGPLAAPADVVAACREAANEAAAQWSSDIAARWWQAALDAYDRLPAAGRVAAERDGLIVQLLEAHSRAGRGQLVLDSVQRYLADALRSERAASAGRVASALLRASGGWPWLAPGHDPRELLALLERAAQLSSHNPVAAAQVLPALAVGHCYHPDAGIAAELLDRAEQAARGTGDPDVLADVLVGRLITYSGVGSLSRHSLHWVDELMALRHNRSREDAVIAHSVATMAAMHLGDVAAVRRHLQAGIAGSEELRLPVLRAQMRWMESVVAMWTGDFAEAERHHGIAAHVHEQTELYEAGSGMLATASLLRERGGPLDPSWLVLQADATNGGQGMVGVVRTALLSLAGEEARAAAAEKLDAWARSPDAAHVWTTLGHLALLAHLAADHGLPQHAARLLAALEPFAGRIAVLGQVGLAGPVDLATARLRALLGDRERALADAAAAAELARRTGGMPTLLRCRLLECELTPPGPARGAEAAALAADARAAGMASVAAAAAQLT